MVYAHPGHFQTNSPSGSFARSLQNSGTRAARSSGGRASFSESEPSVDGSEKSGSHVQPLRLCFPRWAGTGR